jgi:hypothetical protein
MRHGFLIYDHGAIIQRSYAPGSAERKRLEEAITKMQSELPFDVPCVINGKEVSPFTDQNCGDLSLSSRSEPIKLQNSLCLLHM